MGNAQPASGKALELLPEGKRNDEALAIRAPVGMKFTAAEPREQRSGDIIVHEEKKYEVQYAKHWKSGLSPLVDHWELIVTRVKEGES